MNYGRFAEPRSEFEMGISEDELARWAWHPLWQREVLSRTIAERVAHKDPSDPHVFARAFSLLMGNVHAPEDYGYSSERQREIIDHVTGSRSEAKEAA